MQHQTHHHFNKRDMEGFILLIMLLFLQLFLLMGFYSFLQVRLTIKARQDEWQRKIALLQANNIMQSIEENILQNDVTCLVPVISTSVLIQKPIAWWENLACRDNRFGIWYYYAVESVGRDPCGVFAGSEKQDVVPQYYRISLRLLSDRFKDTKILIQMTLAKPSIPVSSCQGNPHLVRIGRQMYREL